MTDLINSSILISVTLTKDFRMAYVGILPTREVTAVSMIMLNLHHLILILTHKG